MTEQEYIITKDLGIISSAKNVLRELIPETSEIVNKKEYQEVMKLISKWERNHFAKIETKD
jgi:phage pi2 protein 07